MFFFGLVSLKQIRKRSKVRRSPSNSPPFSSTTKKMKMLCTGALAAAAVALMVSPLTSALSTDVVGLSASERHTWEAFVEYAIEYEKEYRSLENNHALVQRRFEVCAQLYLLAVGCVCGIRVVEVEGEVWHLHR